MKSLTTLLGTIILAGCLNKKIEVGAATVKLENGTPCFSISGNIEKISINQVQVVDMMGKKMWQANTKTITPKDDSCIKYGSTDQRITANTTAPPLKSNEIYTVGIAVDNSSTPFSPNSYVTNFCITALTKEIVVVNNLEHIENPFICKINQTKNAGLTG